MPGCRVRIKPRIALWLLGSAFATTALGDDDPNRVIVRGRRPDEVRMDHAGSGLRLFPNGASQDDLSAHLRRQGGYEATPTGRPRALGFQLPRIRGHDARFTSLFIDDHAVADPYAALPLAEEMDLPAFDVAEISSGAAPFDVPAVALHGAMRFRLFDGLAGDFMPGRRARISGSASDPSASLISARLDDAPAEGDRLRARVYARQFHARGDYRYYNDNGTPLNPDDDFVTRRSNNDRVARFAMPAIQWRSGANQVKAFGIWNSSRQGIPSLVNAQSGAGGARQRHDFWLGRIDGEHAINNDSNGASTLLINVGIIDDHRVTDDPAATILVVRDRDDLRVTTKSYGAGWRGACASQLVECRISARRDDSRVVRTADVGDLTRRVDHAVGALRIGKNDGAAGTFEAKFDAARLRGERSFDLRPAWSAGWRAGREWHDWVVQPYAQIAAAERAPSLLESEGDGGRVLAAGEITSEASRHAEAGIGYADDSGARSLHAALFRDETLDAIVIVPSSLSSFRAVNLDGSSFTTGAEIAASQELRFVGPGATRLGVSWVWMRAISGASSSRELRIPGVPADQGAISLAQPVWRRPWKSVVARLTSRRRGVVYRDVSNDIQLPPWWIHDAAIDVKWRCDAGSLPFCTSNVDFDVGLSVNNVTDAMSTSYTTSAGARGKTGYSDVWGVPLPGRSWTLSVASSF